MVANAAREPARLRIGVTGHRSLDSEPAIATKVDEVLRTVHALAPATTTTRVAYEVVSPLGEGADRLVADRILRDEDAILEVPLPLVRSEYEKDFDSAESLTRFRALVGRATHEWVVGGSDRVSAYRATGEYVVDSCDVLIAIWDGQPSRGRGGTKDIIDLASARKMPIFVIDACAPFGITADHVPSSFRLVDAVDRYHRSAPLQPKRGASRMLPSSVDPPGEEGVDLARCLEWAELPFLRAEAVAARSRSRFLLTSRLLFLMSALATLAIAISVTLSDHDAARSFAAMEVALMIAATGLWLVARRRIHDRWITARFLTERMRAALFLAFARTRDEVGSRPTGEYRASPQEWITRLFLETWHTRPRLRDGDADVAAIASVLREGWVDPQIAYYERSSARHDTSLTVLSVGSVALLCGAILAAVVHAFDLAHGSLADVVVILSIALPAFAGALIGVAALEQHARHADKFALMARRLGELRARLVLAKDMATVRDVAIRIEAELRTEGDAWVDVMRYSDVELPA
jgi:hypothetical protein